MKKIIFSAFIILTMGWTYAQKQIEVIDLATYKPVANVMVSKADNSAEFGKTNEKGEIQLNLKELNAKACSLRCSGFSQKLWTYHVGYIIHVTQSPHL